MNFNIVELVEKLKESLVLLRDMSGYVKNLVHLLEVMKELGLDWQKVLIPPINDRYISRNEARKILKCGSGTITKLIEQKRLTPYYLPNSNSAKFRLSEVMRAPQPKETDHD